MHKDSTWGKLSTLASPAVCEPSMIVKRWGDKEIVKIHSFPIDVVILSFGIAGHPYSVCLFSLA